MSDQINEMIADLQTMHDLIKSSENEAAETAFSRLCATLAQSMEHNESMREGVEIMATGLQDMFGKIKTLNDERRALATSYDQSKHSEALRDWIVKTFLQPAN